MSVGLVLSGGGIRGVAHIGVLRALDEMGVSFTHISGTSAGALVGSLYASGCSPQNIFEIIKKLSLFRSVRPAWAWNGLLSMDGLKDILLENIPENSFSALNIPLTVAATEIRKGRIEYFSTGELVPAVMASCSVPAIFRAVPIGENLYVDGGLLDNLPVNPIRDKCAFIVGSHCNHIAPDFDPRNLKLVIERSLLIAIYANTKVSREFCDLFIEPPGLGNYSSFDVGRAAEIMERAYTYTKENYQPHHFQKPSVQPNL